MQGLYPAVEHLRKTGVVADFDDWHIRFAQQLCGSARRQEIHAESLQGTGKFDSAGFVGKTDQGFALVHLWSKIKPPVVNGRAGMSGRTRIAYLMPKYFIFLRSVLRFMPSNCAACVWFPETRCSTISSNGFSTEFITMS